VALHQSGYDTITTVGAQPDGAVVGLLSYAPNCMFCFVSYQRVVRYDDAGARDASFGGSGFLLPPTPDGAEPSLTDLQVQPDGKFLVGGTVRYLLFQGGDLAIWRFQAGGQADTGFAVGGLWAREATTEDGGLGHLLLDPDDSIYALASRYDTGSSLSYTGLVHLSPGGAPDTLYSADGTSAWQQTTRYHSGAALRSDYRVVGVGYTAGAGGMYDTFLEAFWR
jgi:hypothetical protein